jgi:hypothetical protein
MLRRFGGLGAATSNPLMERQVSRARGAFERPQAAQGARGALDFAAGVTMPIPIIGDVLGFSSDVARMRAEPEERTALNMGLAALGLLPFVPQGAGRFMAKAKEGAEGALSRTIRQDGNTFYDDAARQYVQRVRFPSGKEGYHIGEVVELIPGKNINMPLGDDWAYAPFKSIEDAWAGFTAAKKADALAAQRARYEKIPSHWKGNDRAAAKTLIDEFGQESLNFISSARSVSKYIQTPNGKVRISDHALPGNYDDDAALNLSSSMEKKTLVEELRRFANPPEDL